MAHTELLLLGVGHRTSAGAGLDVRARPTDGTLVS